MKYFKIQIHFLLHIRVKQFELWWHWDDLWSYFLTEYYIWQKSWSGLKDFEYLITMEFTFCLESLDIWREKTDLKKPESIFKIMLLVLCIYVFWGERSFIYNIYLYVLTVSWGISAQQKNQELVSWPDCCLCLWKIINIASILKFNWNTAHTMTVTSPHIMFLTIFNIQ